MTIRREPLTVLRSLASVQSETIDCEQTGFNSQQ